MLPQAHADPRHDDFHGQLRGSDRGPTITQPASGQLRDRARSQQPRDLAPGSAKAAGEELIEAGHFAGDASSPNSTPIWAERTNDPDGGGARKSL